MIRLYIYIGIYVVMEMCNRGWLGHFVVRRLLAYGDFRGVSEGHCVSS